MWAGRVSAGHVVKLAGQLHLIADSRVRMLAVGKGDLRWLGWSRDTEVLASLHDLISQVASGGELPERARYPRPSTEEQVERETPLFAPDVASFNGDLFMYMLAS